MDPASITTATEDHVQRFLDGRRIGARTRYSYSWADLEANGWVVGLTLGP